MSARHQRRSALILLAVVAGGLPFLKGGSAQAVPNPVATDIATYAAYGRVFPDPHGCLSVDADGDDVNDVVASGSSPWAKGNVCVDQFLSYEEFVSGFKLLEKMFPRFVDLIRFDEAYDNPNYRSAGLPRMVTTEDGQLKILGRDRRPLYMVKVTDRRSSIPERMRYHFAYAGSIHGIERAGAEGQIRAAEDLVTWAAKMPRKRIVETATKRPVPTAGEVLKKSVIYFIFPNPDGWGRGQISPLETTSGTPNVNYTPGAYYQRYNGNGMDLNRDWPTVGYTYRPYTPGSNPEIKAHVNVLRAIRAKISKRNPVGQRFAAGIDLHGQITANAFSFTLMGAGQRDYRKTALTVDQGLRTWADQTARLAWSPYIGTVFETADQWGTVIDTIGYQVTGALGDWFESEKIGLGASGIDNEMSLSHVAPNTVFEPALEQMHIDGNKGLIYSQIASLLSEKRNSYRFKPTGKIGYVFNPKRVEVKANGRTRVSRLPAQNDIDVLAPCVADAPQGTAVSCDEPGVTYDPAVNAIEFDVKGPKQGFWNGGITATMTNANVLSVSHGSLARIALERFDDDHPPGPGSESGDWEPVQESFVQAGSPDLYLPAGQEVTANDPIPGRWRVRITSPFAGPSRIKIDFNSRTAELSPGQTAISASSMDFFKDLNRYVVSRKDKVVPVRIEAVIGSPASLERFDSLVVVNNLGDAKYLQGKLGLSGDEVQRYFAGLESFARGGGNLVLTDAALKAAGVMGIVKPKDVVRRTELAGRYEFVDCNYTPLTKKVCLQGTAGGTSRQAVEPAPLGYSPDLNFDASPRRVMPEYLVRDAGWRKGCTGYCTEATIQQETGLGQRKLGQGVVRIAGVMFPDPNYAPEGPADMRFGLASYALTFSAWQIFLNLIEYRR